MSRDFNRELKWKHKQCLRVMNLNEEYFVICPASSIIGTYTRSSYWMIHNICVPPGEQLILDQVLTYIKTMNDMYLKYLACLTNFD